MSQKAQLGDMPEYVAEKLKAIAETSDKISIAVKADMTVAQSYAQVWLFVYDNILYVVTGEEKTVKGKRRAKLKEWCTLEVCKYALEEYKSFNMEVLPTSNAVTCRDTDGHILTVARCTNSNSKAVGRFVGIVNRVASGENIPPEELADGGNDNCCPKCKRPYKGDIKVCPHCISRRSIFKRLLAYSGAYRKYMIVILAFILISSLLQIVSPYLTGTIFYDEVLSKEGRYYGHIWELIGVLFAFRLFSTLLTIIYGRRNCVFANELVFNLKNDVFSSMQKLSLSFFTDKLTGNLMVRVNQDAEEVQWFFLDGLPYLIANILNIIGVTAFMISMSPWLSALILIPVPFLLLFFRKFLPRFNKMFSRRHRFRSTMISRMNDSFTGFRVVKAFGGEDSESESFAKASERFSRENMRISSVSNTVFPIVHFVMWLGSLTIYILGGILLINGKIAFGQITSLVGYVGMIYGPLEWLTHLVEHWANAMNSANRIFEIIDSDSVLKDSSDDRKAGVRGEVELKDVSFSYVPNRPVLKHVSLHVKPGENIGIVGHSGAGKSTLISLITRLYDCDEGSISFDGVDIRDMSIESVKAQVGIVLQDTFLFIGSVAQNIAYAKPDASMEEIIKAAKLAGAHDFIMRLPDGYDTFIGTGGCGLSGGERQRIALCRAILKDPPILIFDEATSAIDTKTESHIQSSLEELSRGRTTFNIAHRLSTLRNCDRLIVIDNGEIVECGTHAEIYAMQGVYYKLYNIQKEALKMKGLDDE